MNPRVLLVPFLLLPALVACGQTDSPTPRAQSDYKIGDRLPAAPTPVSPQSFRTIGWDDLIPPDWNPMEVFKGLNLDRMQDSDPRTMEALERMQAESSAAPANPKMKGAAIRIPGFMVPLDNGGAKVREFLLVPYFGACIHTPPPPANQIIHVVPQKPLDEARTMDAVWVSGILEIARTDSWMGNSGYRMRAVRVEPYEKKP